MEQIMKDNLTDGRATADTAEAEKEQAAAVPGKFKDVQTLCKAYAALEAEFTRRSQRLKELENGNKEEAEPDGDKASPSLPDEQFVASALASEKVRDAVIADYLKGLSVGGEVALLAGGGGVAAPRNAPKTVKDAGRLAREYLR